MLSALRALTVLWGGDKPTASLSFFPLKIVLSMHFVPGTGLSARGDSNEQNRQNLRANILPGGDRNRQHSKQVSTTRGVQAGDAGLERMRQEGADRQRESFPERVTLEQRHSPTSHMRKLGLREGK